MIPLFTDAEWAASRPSSDQVKTWMKDPVTIDLLNFVWRMARVVAVPPTALENALHDQGFQECRRAMIEVVSQADRPGYLVSEPEPPAPPKATYQKTEKEENRV